MTTRERIIAAAAGLLGGGGLEAVSTRAVCEAAGVRAPTLYHHFGDKEGLLEAVVADGFARYLAAKRGVPASDDPIANLKRGWDEHVAFGVANAAVYALMFPSIDSRHLPKAVGESAGVLRELFAELKAVGRLRSSFTPGLATQTLWAALYGVTSVVSRMPDPSRVQVVSNTVRDGVIAALILPAEAIADDQP
jgi:AcrR family transcriptional regulator